MRVDSLVLVGENRFGESLTLPEALATSAALDVPAVVAAPARPPGYHLEPANDALAHAARSSGGRVARLGRVDPWCGAAGLIEAERCLTVLACRGLFLHPEEEVFAVARAADFFALAARHESPIVISTGHFGRSEPLQIAELAARWPELPIIMSSGGQMNISGLGMSEASLALQQCSNLAVLTNGEYRQDFIESLVDDIGPDRVLYASYAPLFHQAFERERIASVRIPLAAREMVEGMNAWRLFFA